MRMKHEVIASRRRPTNVTLPQEMVEGARELGVNISKACQAGLQAAVTAAQKERWKAENADWIKAHQRWVEQNQLPLEHLRLF